MTRSSTAEAFEHLTGVDAKEFAAIVDSAADAILPHVMDFYNIENPESSMAQRDAVLRYAAGCRVLTAVLGMVLSTIDELEEGAAVEVALMLFLSGGCYVCPATRGPIKEAIRKHLRSSPGCEIETLCTAVDDASDGQIFAIELKSLKQGLMDGEITSH